MKEILIALLIISEVADPVDNWQARFVEIYNPGQDTVDFSEETWYLCKQSNGGSTWGDILLDGVVPPGECHVVAYSAAAFASAYGFNPDQSSGNINGNGDDGYFLFYGGDHATGALMDAYGVVDQDGTGEPWEYLDAKATRNFDKITPSISWNLQDWTIKPGADTIAMSPSSHRESVSWSGALDNDWDNPGNWIFPGNLPFIPDASNKVFIPAGLAFYPTLVGEAFCHEITLGADAASNATLLGVDHLVVNGNALIECFLTGGAISRDDPNAIYHFCGPPVGTIAAIDAFPGSSYVRSWDEVNQEWVNLSAIDSLFPGKGYSVWLPDGDTTIIYPGSLNDSSLNLDLTYTSGGTANPDYDGYNLVSNPFPAGLDWDLGSWTRTNLDATIAIWDGDAGNYLYWNGSVGGISQGIIPPCQGFFVRAHDHAPVLGIPLDACVHSNTTFYDRFTLPENTLCMKVSGGQYAYRDETYIGFLEPASAGFDHAYDAVKLPGLESAPQLYSLGENGQGLAINLLYPDLLVSVPLHFSNGYTGEFFLVAEGADNFIPGAVIILEDLKQGNQVNLVQNPEYAFTWEDGDDPERFLLTFNGLLGEPEPEHNQGIGIAVSAGQIRVAAGHDAGVIYLYNLAGQLLDCVAMSAPETILPVLGGNVYVLCIQQHRKITTYTLFVH